jgi:hypothetical protein
MRGVIEVMGRSFVRRDFRRPLNIAGRFGGFSAARGDDADAACLDFDMHDEQQSRMCVKT